MKKVMKVATYRYFWKNKDGQLVCKYMTDTEEAHNAFMEVIKKDDTILGAMREYINEIDYSKIAVTDTFKEEVKANEEV